MTDETHAQIADGSAVNGQTGWSGMGCSGRTEAQV
eukprot:CAMPEP_0185516650 /NCGR_PEP_ID=MMETSP1366-20130426/66242_1 /TAXON_ID=38817 /ORGANISM="Gephyrocapsa oceanica, Strain RCC1303" /LENGTH=34 /DNA_ID= /DNA_START= /DNA_END= /DNA_ORIENTATION=